MDDATRERPDGGPARARGPRRNRVDPWGDLHAVEPRGLFTGNRGCLVDGDEHVVRHHRGTLWIVCVTEFRDWRWPLSAPRRWTPIFFLDDAVALAAGHRPCGLCRRADHLAYRDAVARAEGAAGPLRAAELDERLRSQRLRPGPGVDRAAHRRLWRSRLGGLPDGTVVLGPDGAPCLVRHDRLLRFSFAGWTDGTTADPDGDVDVITPATSVAALAHGYRPTLHPSAGP